MNEHTDSKLTRRVNYKTRKRSAESLITDVDQNTNSQRCKRSSASRNDDHTETHDGKSACSSWIDNSFTNKNNNSHHNKRQGTCANGPREKLGENQPETLKEVYSLEPQTGHGAKLEREARDRFSSNDCVRGSTTDDLNSSDLWLAEVNLSSLELDQDTASHLQTAGQLSSVAGAVVNTLPEQTTFCDTSAKRNRAGKGEASTLDTCSHQDVFHKLPDSCDPAVRYNCDRKIHSVVHNGCGESMKAEPEEPLNYSGECDLFDESMTECTALKSNHTGVTLPSSGSNHLKNTLPASPETEHAEKKHGAHERADTMHTVNTVSTTPLMMMQMNHDVVGRSESVPGMQVSKAEAVTGIVSLKDKLKNRLLQNASKETPVINPVEELRDDIVTKAQLEASQIRRELSSQDIGPFYGLPTKVQELLAVNRKITKLYDWQDQCLRLPAVYEGRNLIYTLPTSGGKTLVAEILILRQLLCKRKDALLILPYIAIVQEKVRILSEFATELGFLVEEYAGSKGRFPPTKRRQKHSLYVATIEKGQSLVNCLLETERLSDLGLVVVDELHMIGEGGSRGATMESTLLKIITVQNDRPQVIGMSATLNNIQDLASFLHAEVFSSDFRPVALTEYVKVEDNMYEVNNTALVPEDKLQHDRVIAYSHSQESQQLDPDHLLNLVLEIIPDNSCLLFCPTKRYCENVALMLARLMCKHHRHLSDTHKDKRKALLRELHVDGGGKLCPTLKYTVHFGVAYHHSGLTTDERRLIEDAYSDGVLCLLTCTSTLAAGVNLPAKRVILRSPYVGADFLKHSQYKQMTGRAGRAGIDSSGESILIAKKTDMPKVLELLSGPQDVCHSSLMYQGGKGLRTLILSLIGLKVVETTQAIFRLMQKTLLAVQAAALGVDVAMATRESLQTLLAEGLVIQKKQSCLSLAQTDASEHVHDANGLGDSQNGLVESQGRLVQVEGQEGLDTQSNRTQNSDCAQLKGVSQHILTPFPLKNGTSSQASTQGGSQAQTDSTQSSAAQLKGVSQHILTPFPKQRGTCTQEEVDSQLMEDCVDTVSSLQGDGDANNRSKDCILEVTSLGKATFKGSVDLECGVRLYRDLQRGEQSLVVANHLHLLYLVTPYDLAADVSPTWMIYLQQLSALSADEMKVAELIGVSESFIVKKASGQTSRLKVDLLVVQRFYLTLILYDLWRQSSVWDVAERYQQPRGFVQNLLTSASSFASCVFRFCQELPEFWAYQDLLGNFAKRLAYCVTVELIPLMEVPGVKLGRAKQLYGAGFQTLQSLASADTGDLVKSVQFLSHKAARQIISAAKVILEEKAEALMEQVVELVPLPTSEVSSAAAAADPVKQP